ncbi:MAG: imidazolonepropionase [Candidatus Marinimicrobia bacterium]|nr:imidazolonepropionase [Candidatus Neomarinimicrobiota bacterium]
MSTLLLKNIGSLVTTNPDTELVETKHDTQVFIEDGIIRKIGGAESAADKIINCEQKLVTPGFVDPHTHPVFLNGREHEFGMRIAGASYQEIAEKGGGIRSSIEGVRKASKDQLVEAVSKRMDRFLSLGTTTVEAKSGYGLDVESELKSLEVLDEVNRNHPINIIPTFMGAHAFPPEYSDNKSGYVDLICNDMIPAVAEQGIAKFCDVFCENGYFNVDDSRRILEAAKKVGLIPRLHADEFENSHAAELAGEIHAISADHLMAVSDRGIEALKEGNVTATLLPGTTFFLGSHTYAPAKKLKDAGVEIALATDFNPGSCHIQSMPFIMTLATLFLGLSIQETFKAATWSSAKALQLESKIGAIRNGYNADLVIWDLDELVQIPYHVTDIPVKRVIKKGKETFTSTC